MTEENKKELNELTIEHLKSGYVTIFGDEDEEEKLHKIEDEFRHGIEKMQGLEKSVTFYGSARVDENNEAYKKVQHLAYRISKELDCTILSGGGAGIMEAACRGAYNAGGKSIGLTIKLPHEQKINRFATEELSFYFFFARQVSLYYTTEVCIFCPGGFGTLSELFEVLTLRQTGKIGYFPIILFGSEYWNPLQKVIKENLLEKYHTINPSDLEICTITDDEDKILEIIKNSKTRDGEDVLH